MTLCEKEQGCLDRFVRKGKTQGCRIKHAQILSKLDETPKKRIWTIKKMGEAYHSGRSSIGNIAKRFVLEGMEAALGRREQVHRRREVDGEVEAHVVAIACSAVPEGRERWTLQPIADELIRLEKVAKNRKSDGSYRFVRRQWMLNKPIVFALWTASCALCTSSVRYMRVTWVFTLPLLIPSRRAIST